MEYILVIGGIIFTIGFAIYCAFDDGIGGFFFGGMMALVLSVLFFLLGILISAGVMSCYEDESCDVVLDTKTELVALKDNEGLVGHSFLGSGYFDSDFKYVYLYEDPIRGIRMKKLDADYCYIKYVEDGERPYVQSWHRVPKGAIGRFLWGTFSTMEYTFYLPEGSVITDHYEVDLE